MAKCTNTGYVLLVRRLLCTRWLNAYFFVCWEALTNGFLANAPSIKAKLVVFVAFSTTFEQKKILKTLFS